MSVLAAVPLTHVDSDPCGESPTIRLAAAFHELARAQRRLYRRISKDLGFSQIEITALLAVGDNLLLTPKALSDEVGLTTGAVTAMVDRLVKAGYVFRKPNTRDRRSIIIYLTDRGKETLDIVRNRYEQALLAVLDEAPCLSGVHTSQCLRNAAHILLCSPRDVGVAVMPAEEDETSCPPRACAATGKTSLLSDRSSASTWP